MAFPFTKFPSLGDFIKTAQQQGCKLRYGSTPIPGPNGDFVVLPEDVADDEGLSPTELRSFCGTLGIHNYDHCSPSFLLRRSISRTCVQGINPIAFTGWVSRTTWG